MAKKQGINAIEAHLEKIVLAVALLILGWVIYSRILNPPRIEINNQKLKASAATSEAAEKAEEMADRQKEPVPIPTNDTIPPIPNEIIKAYPLDKMIADAVPLTPPYMTDLREIPRGPYRIPDMPALAGSDLQLTHTQAYVPVAADAASSTVAYPYGGVPTVANRQEAVSDVDVVTVEASFRIGELRQRFDNAFGSGSKDPLATSSPAVAVVQLQRSRLLPDGAWSTFEDTTRLPVDPMAGKALTPAELDLLTPELYEVRRNEWSIPDTQLLLLKPPMYRLLQGEWLPESEEGSATAGDRYPTTPRPTTPGPMMPGMMPGMAPGMMADEGMMPGMAPYMGVPMGGVTGASRYPPEAFTKAETISFWAHDASLEPGGIYRYRIRLGFFNPVAGHPNWVEEDQAALATQRVLWTDWIRPEDAVKIPERIIFVPRIADAGTVSIEVYRWQNGKWYNKRYRAIPGTVVGELEEERTSSQRPGMTATPLETQTPVQIDYRTGAMILDVVPNVRYWYRMGRTLKDVVTSEIVYRDVEGAIRRLSVDKTAWPEDLQKLHSTITRQIRELEKQEKTLPGGLTPGVPGMAPGMVPGMMPGMMPG